MSMTDTYDTRTLTALYDTSAEAERAVERLRDAGVPDSAIRVTAGAADASDAGYADRQKGFWEGLGDFFFPDEDRYTYAEGLSRGANMVTVTNYDASLHDVVVDILDDEGSVDLSSREEEWRTGGWGGYRDSEYYTGSEGTAAAGMAAAAAGVAELPTRGTIYDDGLADRDTRTVGDAAMAGDVAGTTTARDDAFAATDRDLDDTGSVKVVEERLDVGKRDVDRGSVRVRSFVREQPVSADVELRSTRVFVERRPVDRAATGADVFQDRTIEAREHAEEAVVRKEARVVEEIGLREESEVHQETVSDTVRRTEVEIEDERTGEVTRLTGDDSRDRS